MNSLLLRLLMPDADALLASYCELQKGLYIVLAFSLFLVSHD